MFFADNPASLEIPWETLEGMLKGISAIDMSRMSLHTLEEAEQFIMNYGYDYKNPEDREELAEIQREALSFIERRLLDPDIQWVEWGEESLELKIPDIMTMESDARKLLLLASMGNGLEQRWACAILKVMHTICHINNAILFHYFEEAKNQIFSRYYKALSYADNGEILLGAPGELRLSITGFETKDEKSRDSMLMKLLCKRENVAEEVFDMIGVRIITNTAAEAVLALEVLRRSKIIIFPNIIPSRSRNSLIDFDEFKIHYQEALDEYQWGRSKLQETLSVIENITASSTTESFNPKNTSTIASYRSIHITERQLIRCKTPGAKGETRFFFPYEIQIVDEANYSQNQSGQSAHTLYKQNQLIQARRRVLGPLFIVLRKKKPRATTKLEPEPLP